MRKKHTILLLLCSMVFALMAAITGCNTNSEYQLFGLTPKSEIYATQGDFVELETLHVYDSQENYYDVKYKVLDSENRQVALSGKGFFAEEAGTYKIVYTVFSVNGTYKQETIVNVAKSTSIRLNVFVPESTDVGKPCEIIIGEEDKAQYTFDISVYYNDEAVEVSDFAFTPTEIGLYTVTLSATSAEASVEETYCVYARKSMIEGEVELFDESWANSRGEWRVKTSEEMGLKDRFGGDGSFLAMETDLEWFDVYIDPKMDKAYYENLAKEGYEYVSVWLYIDGNFGHVMQQYKGKGAFYRKQVEVPAKTWYEIRYNLQVDPQYDYEGSFLKGFDGFADQTQQILTIDNSDLYNGGNGGRERDEKGNVIPYRIYIDDIYAVKSEPIAVDEKLAPSLKAGDTYDLKNMVLSSGSDELTYTVSHRGQSQVVPNGEYTFTENGTYEITVAYGSSAPNRSAQTKFSLQVDPRYKVKSDSLIKEKVGSFVEVELSEFGVVLLDESDNNAQVLNVSCAVSKNGESVPIQDGKIVVSSVGWYDVEIEATYLYGGIECKTYAIASLDVWDEASKHKVFVYDKNTDYFADSYYMNKSWEKAPSVSLLDKVNGKQGSFAKITVNGQQQPIFSVKPLYSSHYYEWLQENDTSFEDLGELFVSFEYMVEDAQNVSGSSTRNIAVYPSATRITVNCGVWNKVTFTLADFVNGYYAQMYDGYAYLNGLRGGSDVTVDATQGYALFYLANWNAYATNIYVSECNVYCETYTGKLLDMEDSANIYAWDYNFQKLSYEEVFTVEDSLTVGGETGRMLCYDGMQQQHGLQYVFVHSKSYYEYVLQNYPSAYVSIKVYVEVEGKADGYVSLGSLGADPTSVNLGKWTTVSISLSEIVQYYDALKIPTTGNAERKSLITVFNPYYANSGEYNNIRIYYQGFDFILGSVNPDVEGIPEIEEGVGNDIFE